MLRTLVKIFLAKKAFDFLSTKWNQHQDYQQMHHH